MAESGASDVRHKETAEWAAPGLRHSQRAGRSSRDRNAATSTKAFPKLWKNKWEEVGAVAPLGEIRPPSSFRKGEEETGKNRRRRNMKIDLFSDRYAKERERGRRKSEASGRRRATTGETIRAERKRGLAF